MLVPILLWQLAYVCTLVLVIVKWIGINSYELACAVLIECYRNAISRIEGEKRHYSFTQLETERGRTIQSNSHLLFTNTCTFFFSNSWPPESSALLRWKSGVRRLGIACIIVISNCWYVGIIEAQILFRWKNTIFHRF